MTIPSHHTYMVSIDPGLSGTGVVTWTRRSDNSIYPRGSWVFKPLMRQVREDQQEAEDDLIARARNLANQVINTCPVDTATAVIEFPEFQASASRMMGWKTGSLQRLTMLVGVMIGAFPPGWRIMLVTPSGWKGQLPKDVVERRMRAMFGSERLDRMGVKTHAWDALGIGEWARRQPWMIL
jgi:hypothetical protein